jgi:hypothetical protein
LVRPIIENSLGNRRRRGERPIARPSEGGDGERGAHEAPQKQTSIHDDGPIESFVIIFMFSRLIKSRQTRWIRRMAARNP